MSGARRRNGSLVRIDGDIAERGDQPLLGRSAECGRQYRTWLARGPGHDGPGDHDPAQGVAPEPPPRAVLEAHLDLGPALEENRGRRRGGMTGTRMGSCRRDEAQPHRLALVGSEHRRHTAELRRRAPGEAQAAGPRPGRRRTRGCRETARPRRSRPARPWRAPPSVRAARAVGDDLHLDLAREHEPHGKDRAHRRVLGEVGPIDLIEGDEVARIGEPALALDHVAPACSRRRPGPPGRSPPSGAPAPRTACPPARCRRRRSHLPRRTRPWPDRRSRAHRPR